MKSKNNNVLTVQMNSEMNLLRSFENAVSNGKMKEFMIVGRYNDTEDYVVAKSQMPLTSEINLAAQLQSSVNIRAVQENTISADMNFKREDQ